VVDLEERKVGDILGAYMSDDEAGGAESSGEEIGGEEGAKDEGGGDTESGEDSGSEDSGEGGDDKTTSESEDEESDSEGFDAALVKHAMLSSSTRDEAKGRVAELKHDGGRLQKHAWGYQAWFPAPGEHDSKSFRVGTRSGQPPSLDVALDMALEFIFRRYTLKHTIAHASA